MGQAKAKQSKTEKEFVKHTEKFIADMIVCFQKRDLNKADKKILKYREYLLKLQETYDPKEKVTVATKASEYRAGIIMKIYTQFEEAILYGFLKVQDTGSKFKLTIQKGDL